jgi:lysophospholipase L1-like esterase
MNRMNAMLKNRLTRHAISGLFAYLISIHAYAQGTVPCGKFLPIGDSISLGVNGGYRRALHDLLAQSGCKAVSVGSKVDDTPDQDFARHESHAGYTISDVKEKIVPKISSFDPDYILIMVGTNDIAWWTNDTGTQIGERYNALITDIQKAAPKAWVLVATIPPVSSQTIAPRNVDRVQLDQDLNDAIRKFVQLRMRQGQKVRLVDVNSALNAADLSDGIHPHRTSNLNIAKKWFEALKTIP